MESYLLDRLQGMLTLFQLFVYFQLRAVLKILLIKTLNILLKESTSALHVQGFIRRR